MVKKINILCLVVMMAFSICACSKMGWNLTNKEPQYDYTGMYKMDDLTWDNSNKDLYTVFGQELKLVGAGMEIREDGSGDFHIGTGYNSEFKLNKKGKKVYIEETQRNFKPVEEESRILVSVENINNEEYVTFDVLGVKIYWTRLNLDDLNED